MKRILSCVASVIAILGISMGVGFAQDYPDEPPNGQYENGKEMHPKDTGTPAAKALCEMANGFGLVAFLEEGALLDAINAGLAAGETVMINVEGTAVTGNTSAGQFRVLGVTTAADGRPVVCYQTY